MARLRKLRRQFARKQSKQNPVDRFVLEPLEPRLLLAADLQVDALGLDMFGPFDWNTTLDLTTDVINAGDAAATGTATVKFYLSDDNTLEVGADTELTENFTVVDLGIGAVSNNTHTVTLPASGTDGDKFLFMSVDSENAIAEDNETNNTNALWIPIGAFDPVTGIDLVAKPADLPEIIDLVWGDTYPACADAFNAGDTNAGAFTIDIVLSADPLFDAGDTSLLGAPVDISAGLNAQTESINDVNVTLPGSGTDGSYYVLVVADSTNYDTGGQVVETFESDNVAIQQVNIVTTPTLTAGVDLMGVDLEVGLDPMESNLKWGETYELDADAYNLGDANAGPFDISIALSADETYNVVGGDDEVLAVVQVSDLDSAALSYNETLITLPDVGEYTDGAYYLVMKVDSGEVFSETDEVNNILTFPINVQAPTPTSGADLVIDNTFIDMMGDPIVWSDTLDANVDLSNIGDAEATGTATVKFYLSDNETLEIGTDTELTGNFTVVNLGAGASSNNNNVTITMPGGGTDGDYYLFVKADSEDAITEGDETNNTWMMPITMGDISTMSGVIDLVSSEMDGPVGPDPLLPNIDLIWGHTYEIPVDVYNAGDTDAGAFEVSVVLEQGFGPDMGGNQYVLTSLPILGLVAGAESINDLNVTLPEAGIFSDGEFHLTILIDSVGFETGGEVTEVFEINNMFGQPVQIVTNPTLSAGVDLKNVDFWMDVEDPYSLAWGETYEIDADIYNIGDTDAAAFDINIVLSPDMNYDPGSDTELTTITVSAGLNSTEFSFNTTNITLPSLGTLSDGNYHLIMKSDSVDVFSEANESDNISTIAIAIGPPVDLVADEIELPGSTELLWGQTYEVPVDAFNAGNIDAGPFDIIVVVSPDENYDPGADQVLATVNVSSGLAAGEDTINDVVLTAPNAGESYGGHTYADGIYYVMVVVDSGDAVAEAFEDNNISIEPVTMVTTSSLSGIDLTAFDFCFETDSQPEDSIPQLAWSETYSNAAEFFLYNAGDTAAGAFDITVRLSDDPYYDGADSEIGTYNVASVGSLAMSIEYMSISMPAPGADGLYYIVTKLDSADAVTETDENNNTPPALAVQIGNPVTGIDLVGAEFCIDNFGPYEWGEPIELVADVYNAGDTDAAPFTVKIYLSPDDTPEPTEEIATLNINALDAGDLMYNDPFVNLPDPGMMANGAYKLIMVVDTELAVTEADKTNNSWILPINIQGAELDLEIANDQLVPPDPLDILWSAQYQVPLDIVNKGDDINPNAALTVVISDDNVFDTDDDVLYSGTVTGVPVDGNLFFEASITIPDAGAAYAGGTYADGTWYIIAFVDSDEQILESDENNNIVVQAVTIDAVNDLVTGIDLIPLHIDIPMPQFDGALDWAQYLPVKMAMYNDGDTDAGAFDITLVLSTDTTYDGGDTVLTSFSEDGLLSDEMAPADSFITLPDAGALSDGDYYIIAKLDSADAVTEADDANNTVATDAITISLSTGTDLAINLFALDAEGPYVWGQSLDVQADLRNAGDTDATDPFIVKFFFNNADTLNGDELELDSFDIASLTAGAQSQNARSLPLPEAGADGNYYLLMQIDYTDAVTETDELNNLFIMPITIGTGQIDLAIDDFSWATELIFEAGGFYPLNTSILNSGAGTANNTEVRVVLSPDATFDHTDMILGSRIIGALGPGATDTQPMNIILPLELMEGSYYIALIADPDNMLSESDETNNLQSTLIQVNVPQPDLTISNFNVPPGPFFSGAMFPIANEVHNISPSPADPCTVTFVLSVDANIDLTDIVIGQRELPGLMSDMRDEQFTDVFIPDDGSVTPGDYYLGIIVDSAQQVAELDENNNTLSVPVVIEPPQIDIVVSYFNPYNPGPFFWGDSVGVTADVRNDGFHPAPASSARIILSQDDLPDATDIILQTIPVDSLMPGMLMPNDLTLDLPTEEQLLPDGEYKLIMVVDSDNAVEEINEDNNSWIVPIYIETPVPPPIDLVAPMGSPPPEPMEWMWGQSYPIPADAFNQSDGPALNFDITVVLSTDDIYDPADQLLGSVHIDELGPWQDSINDLDVTLAESGVLPDGLYHIITFVDSAETVEEIDEMNNISVMPVNIFTPTLVQGVDLQIMEYFLEAGGNIGWGQTYEVVADIFNSGDSDAAPFDIAIALSDDPVFDPEFDTIVGSLSLDGLAAGQMAINDITITLPAEGILPNGPYRLILAIDSGKVVEETDEENNNMDFIINIGQAGADLALMDMMMPFDAAWGDSITIDAGIENWGSEAVGPVTVAFYRSDDWNWDPADELLASATIDLIAGGTNIMTSAQFTLPTEGMDGEMLHIIGVVDPDNLIPEFDEEFNNRQTRDLFVGTAEKPNLMAWPMIMFDPEHPDIDWGDSITLDVMLDNMSNVPVEAFTIKYYLSQDEIVDAADLSLGRSDLAGMQPWDHQQINGVSLMMPGTSPDDTVQEWFILAMADSADVIDEFDENDNTGWNPIYIGSKPADLTGWMAFSPLNPPDIFWGDELIFDVQIENWGAADAGPFDINYYFSLDPEISPDDIPAGAGQTIDLVAAESTSGILQYAVTLPDEPLDPQSDMLFILAHIDSGDVVAEIDEFNNYMGDWYGPDVAASDLVAFYADAGFQALWSDDLTDNEITIFYGLGNFGNQDAPEVQIDFLLAPIDADPAQAFLLGSHTIGNLSAGMDHQDQITLALPTPTDVPFIQPGMEDGTFMLLMLVDPSNNVSEIFEDNNDFFSPLRLESLHGFIEVTDSLNDHYDRMIDFGPVLAGQQVNSFFDVTNHGMGPLNITDITSDNPDFNVVLPQGATLPIALMPQQMMTFEVTFASELEGFQQAMISIFNDDPGMDVVQLNAWADIAGAPIDLTIDAVAAPPAAHWAEPINLNLTISNLAAGDASDEAFLDIMLSDTPAHDEFGMVFHLAGMPVAPLLAGSSIEQQIEIFLPEFSPFGYGGQFFLQAMIHPGDADFEENFMSNELAVPIEITSKAIGKPDLTFTFFSTPPEAAWGMDIPVDLGLRNIGLADAQAFNIRYYLSENDILESKDQFLDEISIPGLSADSEMFESLMVMLPPDGDSDGIHYLIVQIDADNAVEEEFEENNLVFARFHLSSGPAMDLMPQTLNVPAEIVLGEEFDIELLVANISEEPAHGIRVEYFLAPVDQSPEAFGMFIGSMMIDSLPPSPNGDPMPFNFTTMLPHGMVEPGIQYTIEAFIDADHIYEEIDEFNNLITSTPVLASAGELDLLGDLLNPPTQATWAESFNLLLNVSNVGLIDAAPFYIDVLLSSDDVLDDSDFYLTSDMVYGLSAVEGMNTIPLSFDVYLPDFLPSGDGDYTLFVNIDGPNFVPETDEDNNLLAAPLNITGTPDLAVFFEQVPFTSNYDQTITITDVVENWGTSAVDQSFTVEYYFSLDPFFDPLDVELGSRTISSLAAGAQNQDQTELTLTQPPDWPDEGMFHLIAVVDPIDEIVETNEEFLPAGEIQWNNVMAAPIDIISSGMPDLIVASLSSMTDAAEWDQPVWIQYLFENVGTADADEFVATFYLSDNRSITAKDYLLGQITITALASQTTIEDVAELLLPAESPFQTDGEFYIGVRLDTDGQIPEINEENNLAVTDDVVTVGTVITVDLMAAYVDNPPMSVPGEPLDIYYEIYNAGASAAGAFDIDFYLTPGGIIDESAVFLGAESFAALGAEAFQANFAEFSLPQALDQSFGQSFFITMQVNPDALIDPESAATPEKLYDNNILTSLNALTIEEPIQIDAALISLSADTEANWGDTVTVQVDVQATEELGIADIAFYLSRDGSLNDAFELARTSADTSAGPANVQLDLILPQASPFARDGSFQIIALVDPDNLIPENDENNNLLSAPINIGSGKADLVALSISTDPRAAAGDTLEVYNDIENVGSETAANFDIYFYLTDTAAVVDPATDTRIGMRHVASLPPDAVNWTISNLTLPGNLADGTYYLAMVVDKFDDVDESSETNNIIVSDKPLKVKTIVVEPDDYEPNNSSALAKTLTLNPDGTIDTLEATLHNNSDRDYFTFTTPSNASGFAKVILRPDETLNPALMIYNNSGALIGGADNDPAYGGQEIFNSFSLVPGRSYTMLVKPMGESSGAYALDLEIGLGAAGDPYEPNNTADDAHYLGKSNLSLNDPSIHNATDIDFYQFAIPATSTGQVTISVASAPTLDAVLQIYNNQNNLIASADSFGAGAEESIAFDGIVGQKYYAKVSAWAQSTGGYDLDLAFTPAQLPDAYEPNNDTTTAHDLGDEPASLTSPGIHNQTDIDYYALTVPAGFSQIEVMVYPSAGLDAALSLYDSAGDDAFIRFADRAGADGTETLLADGLVKDQLFYLAVIGANDSTGRYALEVSYGNDVVGDFAEPNQVRTNAFPLYLPPDGILLLPDLSLHEDADRDFYSFVAPDNSDGSARIQLKPADDADALNISLRLLGSSGTAILTTDAAGAGETETLNLTTGLESGHTYFIDVNGWGTAGDYQLSVKTPVIAELTPFLQNKPNSDNRPNAWGMTSYGPLPSGGAQIRIVEEIGNPNDDDLSFGTAPVGSTMIGDVVILNTGGASLEITDIASDNGAFTVSDTTASIAAGASQVITVTFTPTQMQLYSDATLTISYGDSSEYTLALSGTGTVSTSKPDIALADAQSSALSQIDFENTIIDGASTVTFLISNTGASNLTVTSALITGADADTFEILQTNLADKSSDNYTITAGGQRAIQVRFLPTATGSHEAVLTLTSNDPDESSIQIPLLGASVAPELIVDLNPADGNVTNALNPLVAFGQQVADGAGGQKAEYPISLVNNGTTDLTISSITFMLAETPFSIEGDGIDLEGFTLAAGETVAARLIFDPDLSANMSGPLADSTAMADIMTVSSDDLDTPVMRFILSGQAVEAYVKTAEDGTHSFTYIDPDGDEIEVRFSKGGSADFTFDGENLVSVDLSSIVITGSSPSTSLIITDTNSEGDGVIDIGAITADGDFGTLSVEGNVTSFTTGGAVKKITIDGTLSGLDAGGPVSSLQAGTLTGTVTAGSFGTVDVEGSIVDAIITADDVAEANIKKFNVGGAMSNSTLTASEIGSFLAEGVVSDTTVNTVGGEIGKLTLQAGADALTVNASEIGSLKVTGDLLDSVFNAQGVSAGIGKVKVSGNADNTDFHVDGPISGITVTGNLGGEITTNGIGGSIKNISVGGNLTAAITANDTIKNIKVGGDISSTLLHLIDAAGEASLNSLTAGGDVSITNLTIEGDLNKLNVGSKKSAGDLTGSLDVDDTLKSLRVYGDIEGDVTAGVSLGKVQATGSLLGESNLACETGDIDSVQFGERIYGTITANNGQGSIQKISYNDRTFRDPDTEQVNLPRNHIVANWTAPKSNSSVQFGGDLSPRLLQSLRECFPTYV